MLGHIYRLIADFQKVHGIQPNLLYLNRLHTEHLKNSFDEGFSMLQIRDLLQMELIIDQDIMHPHVAWSHTAQRVAC